MPFATLPFAATPFAPFSPELAVRAMIEGLKMMATIECPNCRASVAAGEAYCDSCGAPLAAAPPPGPASSLRLIVRAYDNVAIPLPGDRDDFLIGRRDPAIGCFPEVDLVPYGGEEGGVSRRHARLIVDDGNYFVEDLNSVNYTFVNRQKLEPGVPKPIRDGDEIRLGRVLLIFKTD
ncbi:MAG: FHA domain-containing protein [Chloroflexota bacterium]|jgi:hypothetical protein